MGGSPLEAPVFVVADAHGRLDLVHGLLAKAGILDPEGGSRGGNATVVHLGDLANCVVGSIQADIECLAAADDLFDVVLVGNHEHPYFDGTAFSGFWRDPQVGNAIHRLDWQPSFAAGEFLLTHAGLSHLWNMAGAQECDEELRSAWRKDPAHHPFFDQISHKRGGSAYFGGMLWADWSEPKSTAGMSQIVGHTPGLIRVQGQNGHARLVDGRPAALEPDEPFAMCIDLGAAKGTGGWPDGDAIAGCWIRAEKVEVVIYSAHTAHPPGQPT